MNTPLSHTRLVSYFPYSNGEYSLFLKRWDGVFLRAKLKDEVMELEGIPIRTIKTIEDLQDFTSGLSVTIFSGEKEVDISDLTEFFSEDEMLEEILKIYGKTKAELQSFNGIRTRPYVFIRQIHMMIRHCVLGLSLKESGELYDLDHATALHAIKTVNNMLETNRDFRVKSKYLFLMIAKNVGDRKDMGETALKTIKKMIATSTSN